MTIERVEVLVEEPSMEAALRVLLPRMLGGIPFEIYPHQCKSELLQRLPDRLRGYASWIPPSWRVVVIVDRDDEDCETLKKKLDDVAVEAGLVTRSNAKPKPYTVINRIAVEELEAWYFGDWAAVCAAYPRVTATVGSKAKYRNPDDIAGGTWEAFERLLQHSGYFKTGLRKVEAARDITRHMEPSRNSSPSFRALFAAMQELVAA